MPKLFSSHTKKFLKQIDRPERDLNKFICDNWSSLFSNLIFIASEFPLSGNVRDVGTAGRIDILAYNPITKRFVIFELKKEHDKNITDQAADYRDYVQENFSYVYLHSSQKYEVDLPKFTELDQKQVEIILIAKKFNINQIERIKKNKENNITLIKYYWFEDDLIFIDYLNNDPDEIKIESANTRKIDKIKQIIDQDPDYYSIDLYFALKPEAKEAFVCFYECLKQHGVVTIEAQQSKIKVSTDKTTFSVIGMGGKTGRKAILQINTNIDIVSNSALSDLIIEDRYRGVGVKKKGSLGSERYEVYVRNMDEIKLLSDCIVRFC